VPHAANVGQSNTVQKSLTLSSETIALLKVCSLNTGSLSSSWPSSSSLSSWLVNKVFVEVTGGKNRNAGYGLEVICITNSI